MNSDFRAVNLKDVIEAACLAGLVSMYMTLDKTFSPVLDAGMLPSMEEVWKAVIQSLGPAKAVAIASLGRSFFMGPDGTYRKPKEESTATAPVITKPQAGQTQTAVKPSTPQATGGPR